MSAIGETTGTLARGSAQPAGTRPDRRAGLAHRLAVALATAATPMAITLIVTLYGLTTVSIDRDETATIDIGTRTVPEIWRMSGYGDAVHSFYYLVMHFWMGWFGTSPEAIRAPSIIGAVIASGLLALLGTHLLSRRAGITAGILYGCAPMVSAIAHDAREYGLVSAVAVGSTYTLVKALEARRRWIWAAYGFLVVVLIFFHLLTALVLAAHAVIVVWYAIARRSWRPARRWVATVLIVAIVITPLGRRAIAQAGTAGWIAAPTWTGVWDAIVDLCGGMILVAPAAVLIAFAYRRRPANRPIPTVWNVALPWLLLPPTLLLVFSIWHPLYVFRYVLYCLPALMLLIAAGLDRLRWWLHVPIVLAMLAATIPMHQTVRDPQTGANDLRGEAAYISSLKRPGDAIVYLVPTQRYMSHSYPSSYAGLYDVAAAKSQAKAANFSGIDVNNKELLSRLRGVDRLWAVKYWAFPSARPGNRVIEKQRYALFEEAGLKWKNTKHFRGGAILLFERP
jgi:mannosyltransferase